MHVARELIVIVTVVAAIAGVARRIGRTAPLVLVVAGIIASYLPGVDDMTVDPDLILVGILPPLLYSAAIRTSLIDVRSNLRPIGLLSVGYVGFTTVCIGFIAAWLLPIPLAAAFALGAVVAPPDAVAATSIGRKVGMPRRVVTILEGESLVNDATAIVCLRTAIAAMAGSVTALEITRDFARSAFGGVLVGVLAALVIGHIRKKLDDTVLDTTISLLSPWVAYLAAEEIHASGVLAVVVMGLLLGHKAYVIQSAPSRLLERGNWATVQFILEHVVFFLIGLQAQAIVDAVADSTLSAATIAGSAALILVAVIVLRFVWVFPATYVPRWISPRIAERDPAPPWQVPTVISWAGMRGVVTIAAVFLLPDDTPHRATLVLIALVVAAGTLLIQGPTLPWLVRRLGLSGPNAAQDLLTEALLYQKAARAGLAALDNAATGDEPANILARLRSSGLERADAAWESLGGDGETPSQTYALATRDHAGLRTRRQCWKPATRAPHPTKCSARCWARSTSKRASSSRTSAPAVSNATATSRPPTSNCSVAPSYAPRSARMFPTHEPPTDARNVFSTALDGCTCACASRVATSGVATRLSNATQTSTSARRDIRSCVASNPTNCGGGATSTTRSADNPEVGGAVSRARRRRRG